MRRSHLQATRTKLDVHILILNHRNHPVHQRHNHLLALQPFILRVIRIDTHRRIPHDGFRTSSSHHRIAALSIPFHLIAEIIQLAMLLLINHLLIRESRKRLRVPVHHTHPAVNQTLVIEIHKHLDHTLASSLIHGESRTVPVTRSPQLAELLQDNPPVFLRPSPRMLQKLLTRKIRLLDTLLSQTTHYLRFRSNRSMVRTRHPARILTHHTRPTHQDILNRIIKHMPHVENPRHIRRRNHHGIRFTSVRFRTKQLIIQPILVPFPLHIGRVILTC